METFAASFLLGLGSAASPCLLPPYPGFIAYLAGRRPALAHSSAGMLLGVAVLAGILTTMIVVGGALSVIALPFTDVLRWSVPIATVILVLLGLLLLAGRNPFNRLGGFPVPMVRNPLGQAYVYGLLVGPNCPSLRRPVPCRAPCHLRWIGRYDRANRLVCCLRAGVWAAAGGPSGDQWDAKPGDFYVPRPAACGGQPHRWRSADWNRHVRVPGCKALLTWTRLSSRGRFRS